MGHVSFWSKADIDRRPDLIGFDALTQSGHRRQWNPPVQQPPAVPLACYPLDEPGGAPTRFRTFQVCPKDLPSRSVAL